MFEGEETRRRQSFVFSAATTYGTNVAVAVLSLANVVVVSRSLGPTGRGDVAFLTTIGTLSAYLFNMGVQQSNANLGGTNPELRRALASNSVLMAIAFGGLAMAVVLALVAIFPAVGGHANPGLRLLALGSVVAVILWTYLANLLQSEYAFLVTNISWLVAPLTNVSVNGFMSAAGRLSVGTAITTWVVGWSLAALVLVRAVARGAGFGRPDLELARQSLGFGLKAHAGRAMLVGNYRADQWFIGVISGSRELGLYSIAVAWAELLFFLPTTLASVQRPHLVRAGTWDASRFTGAVFRLTILVTGVLAAVLVLTAPFLCVTVFGARFSGSIDDLRFLALGGFGIVALKLLGNVLTAQRRPMRETVAIGVGFVASIVLDIALVPPYGGAGAALASTLSYLLGGMVVIFIFVRTLGSPLRELLPRRDDVATIRRQLMHLLAGRRGAEN